MNKTANWNQQDMYRYVAVLGRQPKISVAELEALFSDVKMVAPKLAEFASPETPDIKRLGGTVKIGIPVDIPTLLTTLPLSGKITLGVSDFSRGASARSAQKEALQLKRTLTKSGRSVRVVPNQTAELSSATSLHNHLFQTNKIELLKNGKQYYRVIALSNIEDYVRRDRKRPARDAKVGMLPPKLAQILINLCGNLPLGTRLLDPFCGTGVVLQEAILMGYEAYGTDLSDRMVDYTQKNLNWLETEKNSHTARRPQNHTSKPKAHHPPTVTDNRDTFTVEIGDATTHQWQPPLGAVACEAYLGPPMSQPPAEIKLREAKQTCKTIILSFLKNLSPQLAPGTPVVIAIPAWLRPNGGYERLNLLDEIANLRYNVYSFKNLSQKDLLYHREGQVVAREIIVLRKK